MAERSTLTPEFLAEKLNAWAFKREKVLHLLDHRAAMRARELARQCEDLEEWALRDDVTPLELELVWLELREQVVHLLVEERASNVPNEPSHVVDETDEASPRSGARRIASTLVFAKVG